MDTFLNSNNVFKTLMEQYQKHKKIIVAYDFDDTIAPGYRADDCFMVQQLIRDLRPYAHLICYTARDTLIKEEYLHIEDYLTRNNVPFDYINKEWDGSEIKGKKLFYNVNLCDKCGLKETYNILRMFIEVLETPSLLMSMDLFNADIGQNLDFIKFASENKNKKI